LIDALSGPAGDDTETVSLHIAPHRSLGPRGFVILMGFVGVISFAAGLAFWLMGAWPVFFFFGLDVALIYWAFKANYAQAREWERIDISANELVITRSRRHRPPERTAFQPYWVRIDLAEDEFRCGPLLLRSHGRSVEVGAFLASDERRAFAGELRDALQRFK